MHYISRHINVVSFYLICIKHYTKYLYIETLHEGSLTFSNLWLAIFEHNLKSSVFRKKNIVHSFEVLPSNYNFFINI